MNWLIQFFLRKRRYRELSESMAEHIEEKADEFVAQGMSRSEARRAALRAFGNVTLLQERSREVWKWGGIDAGWHVAAMALRNILRMRSTAVLVVVTLTLGISANLVLFTLINAIWLRPLPFPEPQRLVALDDQVEGKSAGISWEEAKELQQAPQLFSETAAFKKRTWALSDHSGAALDVVLSGMVTPHFFQVLGMPALAGSTFAPDEGAANEEHTAVLSYELWQRRYRADPWIVNRLVSLNDVPYRILGVMPKNFEFAIEGEVPDLYIPLNRTNYCCSRQARGLDGIGRLARGVSLAAARERLKLIAAATRADQGAGQFSYDVVPLQSFNARNRGNTLLLLWIAALILGAIASLNAGAVLLARSLRNLRQYALKISLGATLRHLVQEQLAQAIMLSIAASALALGCSALALKVSKSTPMFAPLLGNAFRTQAQSIWDWRVFSFCVLLSVGSASFATLFPLVVLRRFAMEQILRSHSGLGSSRHGKRLRTVLIVGQLGLSVTLLSAALSFGHSLYDLLTRSPGFRTSNLVMAGVGVPEARYDTDAKMISFHEQVLESIRALPGVKNAGFAAGAPVNPLKTRFLLDGDALPLNQRPRSDIAFVSPEMFNILGLPILRGRGFLPYERIGQPLTAVVNKAFADEYLDPRDPLRRGVRVSFYNGNLMQPWSHFDLVGIVGSSRNRAINHAPEPQIYLSTQQVPLEGGEYFLDTAQAPSLLVEALPAAIWRVDPQIEKVSPYLLRDYVERGLADRCVTLYLFLGFAFAALFLATLGLGASISAGVSEATKEIGIRSALGESRGSLALRVLRASVFRCLSGAVIGVFGSLVLLKVAHLSLVSQKVIDPKVTVIVLAAMGVVALLVSALPLRRALTLSAVEALRVD